MSTFNSRFHVGDIWVIAFTIKDRAGTLSDPTAVTLAVTAPDGTASAPTATKDSTGTYHANVALTQAGAWHAVISTSGSYQGVEPVNINVYDTSGE